VGRGEHGIVKVLLAAGVAVALVVVGVLLVLSVVSPSFLSWASGLIRGRTGLRSRSTAGTGKRSLP